MWSSFVQNLVILQNETVNKFVRVFDEEVLNNGQIFQSHKKFKNSQERVEVWVRKWKANWRLNWQQRSVCTPSCASRLVANHSDIGRRTEYWLYERFY